MISATVAVTTVANAPPMTNATASSTRLPRMTKSLKPLSMSVSSEKVEGGPRDLFLDWLVRTGSKASG